jgi:hypothetical protein
MADPPRPAQPPRVQDVAREYARDVLPAGPRAGPPPRPSAPPAPGGVKGAARELAREGAQAAQRVREMAKDFAPVAQRAATAARDVAKDFAQDLAEGVRRSSRYVRMRAAILASLAVVTLASVWIACPSSGPTNDLGAEVKLGESFLGTQILVRNESGDLWTDVSITLDGGWKLERRTVRPGDELVVSVAQFTKDGAYAPRDLRPETVTIDCREGRARTRPGKR